MNTTLKGYQVFNDTWYDRETKSEVIQALETVRLSGMRCVLDYGDTETGRSWGEVNGIRGTIGRSTGDIKIPILLANKRSTGGGGILDNCIIAIKRSGKDGEYIYKHPNYNS